MEINHSLSLTELESLFKQQFDSNPQMKEKGYKVKNIKVSITSEDKEVVSPKLLLHIEV